MCFHSSVWTSTTHSWYGGRWAHLAQISLCHSIYWWGVLDFAFPLLTVSASPVWVASLRASWYGGIVTGDIKGVVLLVCNTMHAQLEAWGCKLLHFFQFLNCAVRYLQASNTGSAICDACKLLLPPHEACEVHLDIVRRGYGFIHLAWDWWRCVQNFFQNVSQCSLLCEMQGAAPLLRATELFFSWYRVHTSFWRQYHPYNTTIHSVSTS